MQLFATVVGLVRLSTTCRILRRKTRKNGRRAAPVCSARTTAVYLSHQFTLAELRTANGGSGFFHRGVFCFQFFRGGFLRGCFARSFGCRRACATARIEIELPHFVEQRLVADAQHLRRVFAAPICFLQRVGDGFHLRFVLQSAHQSLQPLFLGRRSFFARRGAMLLASHFQKFAEAALVVFQNYVALHEVLEFAQISRPRVAQRCF